MRTVLHHTGRQALLAAVLTALPLLAGGCENNKGPLDYVTELAKPLLPPKPAELAQQLNNTYDADKRRQAVALLSATKFGGGEAYVALYRKLMFDPDATVRAASIKAVGVHGNVDDVPQILRVIFVAKPRGTPIVYDADHYPQDQPPSVRWEVAQALQKIHNPMAVPALMTILSVDESPDVRMAAATALGQYSDPLAFDALVTALDDHDYGVVQAARLSLTCLTGNDQGIDPLQWQTYRDAHHASLFKDHQTYLWQPYITPHSFWNYVEFWKDYEVPAPQPPTGISTDAISPPTTAPARTSSR